MKKIPDTTPETTLEMISFLRLVLRMQSLFSFFIMKFSDAPFLTPNLPQVYA